MRLVASTPDSKPVPEAVRGALAAVSPEDLREIVERISVPRPTGTPENVAVRRTSSSPSDTPETLDSEFLAGVTGLLVHVALSSLPGGAIMSRIETAV